MCDEGEAGYSRGWQPTHLAQRLAQTPTFHIHKDVSLEMRDGSGARTPNTSDVPEN